MSLVYITYHDENIKDIEKDAGLNESTTDLVNYTNYVSKYNCNKKKQKQNIIDLKDGTKLLTDSNLYKHRTMGEAEVLVEKPCQFLKKRQGIKWRRERRHTCVKSANPPPPLPKLDPNYKAPQPKYNPKKVQSENKQNVHCPHKRYFRNHQHRDDFVKLNIEKNKAARTCTPLARYIDTPNGEVHTLVNTGLVPQYICGKNFGKIPIYLKKHKQLLHTLKEKCKVEEDNFERKCLSFVKQGIRPITDTEREEIIMGLKTNLADLMKRYQQCSLYSDTLAKRIKKGRLEDGLRQLENDIFLMESNKEIYVSDY